MEPAADVVLVREDFEKSIEHGSFKVGDNGGASHLVMPDLALDEVEHDLVDVALLVGQESVPTRDALATRLRTHHEREDVDPHVRLWGCLVGNPPYFAYFFCV